LIVWYWVKNYFEISILSLDLIDVVVQFQLNFGIFVVHQGLQRIGPLMDQHAK